MDSAVQKTVGEPNVETACANAHKIFSYFADHLEKVQKRDQLKEVLAKAEVNAAQLRVLIGICNFSPQLLRWVFSFIADKAKQDLPAATGRPKALRSNSQELEVCEFVGKLFSHGVELEKAYSRAAQRYGISAYTVRRLWKKRGKIAAGETVLSYDEVAQATAKLLE